MNNLKLNSVVCFALIYTLINKLIISNIKITNLKIWFVCFGSKSVPGQSILMSEKSKTRQTLSFLLVNSVKSLLIQSADGGIYFLVFLMQTLSKILLT